MKRTSNISPKNRRGIAIIDMLLTGLLMMTLLYTTTYIIMSANTAARNATRSQLAAQRFDNVIDQLRRDIWNAETIKPAGGGILIRSGGAIIGWNFDERTNTRFSSDGLPPRIWNDLPPIKLAVEGKSVRVTVGGKREKSEMLLASQIMLEGAK
jgi:hypothetical protein